MDEGRLKDVITEEEVIGFISELVKIPSYSGMEKQENEVAEFIHYTFIKEGIISELIEVEKERYNVVATLKGKGKGKNLLLTGHMDTVPAYDMKDPFTMKIDSDKLYGRGVADMKGPLACMIYSMIAIKRAKLEPLGDIIFAGVIDEEEGSLGTIDLIEKGIKADAAIVGEPTNLDLCVAHRGLEWFEIRFHGKAVHGGKQKDGINAIKQASKFIQRCEEKLLPKIESEFHDIIGMSSMNYGTIHGGTQPSTVAGECILRFDRRWVPGVSYQEVVSDYENIIKQLEEEDPEFQCELRIMEESVMKKGFVHEAMETDPEHPIIPIVIKYGDEIIGKKPDITYFPAWTDGGLLSQYAGIPTVVFGPGELESAHSSKEHIDIKQLLPATLTYAKTAMEFCK